MENWERNILKNLHDYHKELDWAELPENLSEFWARIPEITVDERGLILSVSYDEHELVLGFGEYGGYGDDWDGQLCWQTWTHKDEPTNWEFEGWLDNRSPKFVWHTVYKQLGKQIELRGQR